MLPYDIRIMYIYMLPYDIRIMYIYMFSNARKCCININHYSYT